MSQDNKPPSLLVLSPPPTPATPTLLAAAYKPPLEAILGQDPTIELTVALLGPWHVGPPYGPFSLPVGRMQAVLDGVYGLLAGLGATRTTVVFVGNKVKGGERDVSWRVDGTIVSDLRAFVGSRGPWGTLYRVDTEGGVALFKELLDVAEGERLKILQEQIVTVPGGLAMSVPSEEPDYDDIALASKVCLGGTFDHLHIGHKLLLTTAVLLLSPTRACSAELVIGITADEMLVSKKHQNLIESWAVRAAHVADFLDQLLDFPQEKSPKKRPTGGERVEGEGSLLISYRDGAVKVRCVAIKDAFGPTITEENLEILVVSGETRKGGEAVNSRRAERGWAAMRVVECGVLGGDDAGCGENFSGKISSSAIREAEAAKEIRS